MILKALSQTAKKTLPLSNIRIHSCSDCEYQWLLSTSLPRKSFVLLYVLQGNCTTESNANERARKKPSLVAVLTEFPY